jgi:lysyl-tRNA synthetase, class I
MEKFFWADAIADEIIKRKKKAEYVCASGIGVSGTLHIGNFRDGITTDLVVRALRDKGKKVRFVYSWDDFDRFRKVPANVPKNYEKYIGMPVSDILSPFKKGMSYTKYFEDKFKAELVEVGVKPKFISQSEMNRKCKYASLIKKSLDNNDKIKRVLNKYRKEPLGKDWYPVSVYCEKCCKDFTKIIDAKGYEIEYECKCGFKDKIDYREKGIVKLKWRVDWPARWKYEGVDFEPGGGDIGAAGGSYVTGKEIAKNVFDYEAPKYVYYEMINFKGESGRFSGSKGNVLTVSDLLEIYEPEILRYLFVGTRPNKGFQISFDADVIKVYDEYDLLEEKYFDKIATPQERRIYELSQVKPAKKRSEKLSFRHLVTFVQTGKTGELNAGSKLRAEKVKNWLENYAPEDFKFEVQEKISVKLDKKQKQALIALKESLAVKDFTEDELFNEFYEICKAVDISNKEFFGGAYGVIINKARGPRLAALILAIGKDKVVELLGKIK